MKITPAQLPFQDYSSVMECFSTGDWPADWITGPDGDSPHVLMFRLKFTMPNTEALILHVAAAERYELYLDGMFIGRGNESGDLDNHFFDSWSLVIPAGEHILWSKVPFWGMSSPSSPAGRISSYRPGFIVAAEGSAPDNFNTGFAAWECCRIELTDLQMCFAVPCCCLPDMQPYDDESWSATPVLYLGRDIRERNIYPVQPLLCLSELPEMALAPVYPRAISVSGRIPDDHLISLTPVPGNWKSFLRRRGKIVIEPEQELRVILLFPDYCCVWPKLIFSGGKDAVIKLAWAESAFDAPENKGRRDICDNKYFIGFGDYCRSNGKMNQHFAPLFWQAGRIAELTIRNAGEPLVLQTLEFTETHYPLVEESAFQCTDPRYSAIVPILLRTLRMCTHDVFMDCPYYERLMYIGDGRTEALALMAATRDARPVRRAITLFSASRSRQGFTLSRYPSLHKQLIAPYSLIFTNMLHDYALWRDDPGFVQKLVPRIREILAAFEPYISDGLLHRPPGWNFIDWSENWVRGEPIIGGDGVCGVLNWQYICALEDAARLEDHFGHSEFAGYYRGQAAACAKAVIRNLWDTGRGMFADDTAHRHFSEHNQCLALLTSQLSQRQMELVGDALVREPELARTTVYFSHYLFEAAYRLKRPELFYPRLKYWFDLPAQGFQTVPERPEPSRSDCHAWGTHPYYHFFATMLGIRPGEYGFNAVEIAPMPGKLQNISGILVHPKGEITVEIHQMADRLEGRVILPPGIKGTFRYNGQRCYLHGGRQDITIGSVLSDF